MYRKYYIAFIILFFYSNVFTQTGDEWIENMDLVIKMKQFGRLDSMNLMLEDISMEHAEFKLWHQFYKARVKRKEKDLEGSKDSFVSIIKKIDENTYQHLFLKSRCFYNIGYIYDEQKDAIESIKYHEKALESLLASETEDDYWLATYYRTIGINYIDHGHYDQSEKYLNLAGSFLNRQSQALFYSNQFNPWQEVKCDLLYSYCHLYRYKEDFIKLDQYLDAFLKYYNSINPFPGMEVYLAGAYNSAGDLYVKSNPQKAIEYINVSKSVLAEDNYYFQLQYDFNLAKAYTNLGDYQQALSISESILSIAQKINDVRLPFFNALKGNALLKLGRNNEAILAYSSMAEATNSGEHQIVNLLEYDPENFVPTLAQNHAFLYSMIANIIQNHDKNDPALTHLVNKLNRLGLIQYRHEFRLKSPSQKQMDHFESMLIGILETNDQLDTIHQITHEDLINEIENAESSFLWEQLIANRVGTMDKTIDSLSEIELKIRQEIVKLKKKEESEEIRNIIFQKELDLNKINTKMNEIALVENYSFDETFDLLSFQETLDPDECRLKYIVKGQSIILVFITSTDFGINLITQEDSIENWTIRYIDLLRSPTSSIVEIEQLGHRLYSTLIPIDIRNYDRYTIIPDDYLCGLSFETLYNGTSFLVNEHIFSYATSLRLSSVNESLNPSKNNQIAFFAPSYSTYTLSPQEIAVRGEEYNLQGTLEEVEEINKFISGEVFDRGSATKGKFLEVAPRSKLIHLAMHSFVNDDDPDLSYLAFTDKNEDYKLYLNELYGLNLNAELAVLSSCNSGVGTHKDGDGMISLSRAFTYAGVPSVIASLWSAPDAATKDIMVEFYRGIDSQQNKAQALRLAKLNYLKSQSIIKLKHPYYWSGFVLYGDNQPIVLRSGITLWPFILTAAMVAFFLLRRKVS